MNLLTQMKKKFFNTDTIVYHKEYALRALTELYSFTGLKIVNNNSGNSQKQTIDTKCSPQILKTKKTRTLDKNPKKLERNKYPKQISKYYAKIA